MLSENNPPFFRLRFLAVFISCLALVPASVGRGASFSVGAAGSMNAASSVDDPDALGFAAAVEQNTRLMLDLNWTFGGKSQRGWYLYQALIQRLINTDSDPSTSDFAVALSEWQKSAGLASTGVLDRETWMRMVSVFQSQRIKNRSAPPPEQLTLVPASEFYDPERPEQLRHVERRAYAAYQKIIAAVSADLSINLASNGNWLKIISAFRSPAYQAELRKRSPRAGRAGLAVNSPHFTGRALDLYMGGDPVSTDDRNRAFQVNTKVYQWMVRNAERFGFYPYFYEPWHWEYRLQR